MAHEHNSATTWRLEPLSVRGIFTMALSVAFVCGAYSANARPATKRPATQISDAPEITEKQADLGEIQSKIKSLRKDLSASENDKANAANRLRDSERKISALERELRDFSTQQARLEKTLKSLEDQSETLGTTLNQQQAELERLLYKQYLRGSTDSLQLLLNGNDPNQIARDLHYLSAIALTRAELMGEINATLDKKMRLAANAKERHKELADLKKEQQKRHTELEEQRTERKALYAEVSNKVKSQRKEINELREDEKRLTRLIDQVSKRLAAQAEKAAREARAAEAAEAAKRAEAARRNLQAHRANDTRETAQPVVETEASRPKISGPQNNFEPVPNNGSFAKQKGRLRLPVKGTIAGKFGSERDSGSTWRGLFIKTPVGSGIKAIANGRIVFAEWMRGFGNLLIIDHGDSYLSIYGYNDSILKQVGQAVTGGETIATAGNSGGNQDSGLYFELRHKGRPIDPMKWASLK